MASKSWSVEYYETANGESIIENEMKAFGPKVFAKILRTVDLLEENGPELRGGYTDHVRGKIWELRVGRQKDEYRVLYFAFTGRSFVLLRAFFKKTRATPGREIAIAERRMEDYLARQE